MLLYKAGEIVLKRLQNHRKSLKNLVFASNYKNPKQLYALVCETLKYQDVLEEIISNTKFQKHGKGMSKQMITLLLYDFLFGKGIQCSGKFKEVILSRKSMLHSSLARIKITKKVTKNEELIQLHTTIALPKYLRVNTLKSNFNTMIDYFKSKGFSVGENLKSIEENTFLIDKDIQNLLIFNNQLDMHKDPNYLNGHVIFQDKSSCIPAEVLHPPTNSVVIDACAAPGNKTSHLAALMQNTGRIYAFDMDENRLQLMKKMINRAGVTNCTTKHCDFLKVSPSEYKDVTHILVDPSCTGSGIVSRLSQFTDNSASTSSDRLQSLSRFQLAALNHALSFPNACRVVYSTCSINDQENESVVMQALDKNPQFKLQKCLLDWQQRGKPIEGFKNIDAEKCIRCCPDSDYCNGFFVAVFQRTSGAKLTGCSKVSKSSKKRKLK